MPLFFFLSGIFFKPYPVREFVAKKINTLVIPFFFFYIAAYLYRLSTFTFFKIFSSSDGTFDFGSIFSIFNIFDTGEVELNLPLWFIVVLIIFQTALYSITRICKSSIGQAGWCIVISFAMTSLSSLSGTHIVSNLWLFIFYCTGFIFGKRLVNYIENTQFKSLTGLFLFGISMMILTRYISSPLQTILSYLSFFTLIFMTIITFKYISKIQMLHKFIFWGKNSYIILGLHLIFIDFWSTVYVILFQKPLSELSALPVLFLTISSLYPVIIGLNRFCPALVGKKPVIMPHHLKASCLFRRGQSHRPSDQTD